MLHYAIFALVAVLVVLTIVINLLEQARIFGWASTAIEFIAAVCLAVLLGSLAAAGI